MEFLYEYGLFLAKAVTIVIAIMAVVVLVLASSMKNKADKGELRLTDISDELLQLKHQLKEELLSKKQFKAYESRLRLMKKPLIKRMSPRAKFLLSILKAVSMRVRLPHCVKKSPLF
ncbi:hypothetical protein GCM10009411_15380 [Shewanella litoralis]|uniref:Peptidase S49 N-terminal proteobacteria domain-containing protein n=1 Tax=Shewanella litoralis TaxID=2282700 RepID=A0ABQ2R728_9GAMM|nr:hypothetical protein GCM10009411_15380 [Shewanella litoralis]